MVLERFTSINLEKYINEADHCKEEGNNKPYETNKTEQSYF